MPYIGEPLYTYVVTPEQVTEDTAPTAEPISLPEIRQHLRVDYSDDDIEIAGMITAARMIVERKCNRSLAVRTNTAHLPGFYDRIELPGRPFNTLLQVQYYNDESPSVLTTLYDSQASPVVPSSVFRVDPLAAVIYKQYGQSWPTSGSCRHDALQITYTTGESSPPAPVIHAIKLIVGDFYENREGSTPLRYNDTGVVDNLLSAYRYYR